MVTTLFDIFIYALMAMIRLVNLYWESPIDSEYDFASTCGRRDCKRNPRHSYELWRRPYLDDLYDSAPMVMIGLSTSLGGISNR